jgi:hypothetical protein
MWDVQHGSAFIAQQEHIIAKGLRIGWQRWLDVGSISSPMIESTIAYSVASL